MSVSLRKADRPRRDTVSVETLTVTTHHVHVDLAALLGAYDMTDNVVLLVGTPSGRVKRVALNGGFLVEPRRDDDHYEDPFA